MSFYTCNAYAQCPLLAVIDFISLAGISWLYPVVGAVSTQTCAWYTSKTVALIDRIISVPNDPMRGGRLTYEPAPPQVPQADLGAYYAVR